MSNIFLLACFLAGLITISGYITFVAVRQLPALRLSQAAKKQMRKLRANKQPAVTVLIYVHSRSSDPPQVLAALSRMRYKQFDVVIVDDTFNSGTTAEWQEAGRRYKNHVSIRVLRRRRRTSAGAALLAGYKKSQRGDLVITLPADIMLDEGLIKRAVATWQLTGQRAAMPVPGRIASPVGLLETAHMLDSLYSRQCNKGWLLAASSFKKYPGRYPVKGRMLWRYWIATAMVLGLFVPAVLVFGIGAVWCAWVLTLYYGLGVCWLAPDISLADRILLTLALPVAPFLIVAASTAEATERALGNVVNCENFYIHTRKLKLFSRIVTRIVRDGTKGKKRGIFYQ